MTDFFKSNPMTLRHIERDKDKKTYELMDMPIDVMENIVDYLDIFDRIKLAKTSRSLQTFVEDQKLFHHTLRLNIEHHKAIVSLNDSVKIEYIRDSVGCKRTFFKRRETLVRGVHYWKQALLDFKRILKNPKLHLDTLHIVLYVNDEDLQIDVINELKFTHYLNVKRLVLHEYSWDHLPRILPSLKPEYLTTIKRDYLNPKPNSMAKVFEMEQWKRAKHFFMFGDCFIWPLCHLYHFEQFTVFLKQLSVEDTRQMKKILFKSKRFEKCLIIVSDDNGVKAIKEEFGDYIQQEQNSSNDSKICHYPIPNSTECFEIKVGGSYINITRMKR